MWGNELCLLVILHILYSNKCCTFSRMMWTAVGGEWLYLILSIYITLSKTNMTPNVFLLYCFLVFHMHNYSDCVLGCERCQNISDLHVILCLNASCLDTNGALRLLMLFKCACSRHTSTVSVNFSPLLTGNAQVWLITLMLSQWDSMLNTKAL